MVWYACQNQEKFYVTNNGFTFHCTSNGHFVILPYLGYVADSKCSKTQAFYGMEDQTHTCIVFVGYSQSHD